jgi:hypothetical protein
MRSHYCCLGWSRASRLKLSSKLKLSSSLSLSSSRHYSHALPYLALFGTLKEVRIQQAANMLIISHIYLKAKFLEEMYPRYWKNRYYHSFLCPLGPIYRPLHKELRPGFSSLFLKSPESKYFRLSPVDLSHKLLNSTTATQKQPQKIHEYINNTMF